MSGEDFHQILVPYLFAGGATFLILLIATALLKRDGAKQRAREQAKCDRGRTPRRVGTPGPSAKR